LFAPTVSEKDPEEPVENVLFVASKAIVSNIY
jgi:hypothetical protein